MSDRRRVFCALEWLKCDRAILCSVFFWCLAILTGIVESGTPGICAMDGCNCTVKSHRWITVKCVFSDDQDVELLKGSIPLEAREMEVSHCRELRIQAGVFQDGTPMKRVRVSGISSFVAKQQAFQNLSSPNIHLEVAECNSVILESHAFKNSEGTLSLSISRCKHVAIKPNAFSRLLWITVKEVPSLVLSSNAFKFDPLKHGRHGPATQITFQSVRITELPSAVFPTAIASIRMDDLWARVIRKDAFRAVTIFSVIISNSTILEIEAGAFNNGALISSLKFIDVTLNNIERGAFRSPHDNLTIQYSRLYEVETGAIDTSAVNVTLTNNEFLKLREGAIVIHQCNRISIEQNLFGDLESDAISAEVAATSNSKSEFSFTGNRMEKIGAGSLRFIAISEKVNEAQVKSNYFKEMCSCNLETWMREITGGASRLMDSSYCTVDRVLDKCFNFPEGYLAMKNYTKLICTPGQHVECEKPSGKEAEEPRVVTSPSVGPHVYPRHKGYFDAEASDREELQREKRIVVVVCVLAVFTVLVVILASGILYARRRGVCPKLASGHLTNLTTWLGPASGGVTAAASARSISRLSVHEYAELQLETRILDAGPRSEQEGEEGEEGEEEDDNLYAYTENKATQTLPEELTEEYLRDLRERLNDPENYGQARDAIEYLYDLIKVEESCNNNNERIPREGNAYDAIQPKRRKPRGVGPPKAFRSMGTKSPSLEKLFPSGTQPTRPLLTEYAEPRDRRTNDRNYLYAELAAELAPDETVPSTSRLSQPILASLAARAQHPLPPCSSQEFESGSRNQTKSMRFLETLGESILGPAKSATANTNADADKRPNFLLCEYTEPSDASLHLYSELPDPRTSTSPSKMANRPLPTKPD